MPCLELKAAIQRKPEPVTRLRLLLEKPGAAVLRRNFVAEADGAEHAAAFGQLRVTAVLAVDLTNPPQEKEASDAGGEQSAGPEAGNEAEADAESADAGFAKGVEVWIADRARTVCVHADADELAGALAMFDAYLRLARYQPAFQRLDQRRVGFSYAFREGLVVGIQGTPGDAAQAAEVSFASVAAIPEIDDFRDPRFSIRLPDAGVNYFHNLLRSAAAWLDENSYPNILGSK